MKWHKIAIYTSLALVLTAIIVGDFLFEYLEREETIEAAVVMFKTGDYREALLVLEPYAFAGDSGASHLVAIAYADGLGVERNREKAVELFKIAYKNDEERLPESFFWTAESYELGRETPKLSQDLEEALAWYKIAAKAGHPDADNKIKLLHKELQIEKSGN